MEGEVIHAADIKLVVKPVQEGFRAVKGSSLFSPAVNGLAGDAKHFREP